MINGKNYDWEDVKIFLNGVPVADVDEINYTDEQEFELLYAAGSMPIGAGRGNYKGSGDINLKREAYDELNNIARAVGKRIYDFRPGLIVVSYGAKVISEDSDFIGVSYSPLHTETLQNVLFTKRNFATKQNDKENTIKLEFIFEKIT
jgi:acetoin utilization deacetylase AcuC-like enzyme